MKKIAVISALFLLCFAHANVFAAEETMKIAQDGVVEAAKDVPGGRGISFTLPDIEDGYRLSAIELAVFEKKENETEYSIYTDENEKEAKKQMLQDAESLNIQVDFGDSEGYRSRAKYKLAYRYHLISLEDESIILIAGENEKEGWRLIGEKNPLKATDTGFTFYKNESPELTVNSFEYTKHSIDGDVQATVEADKAENTPLPMDAFKNGVKINFRADDFDTEDTVKVEYVLKDANKDAVIEQGYLNSLNTVTSDTGTATLVSLTLKAEDNFGGVSEEQEYIFSIDTTAAFVTKEFNDGGYWLAGKCLFSDFTIYDNTDELMESGNVRARIFKDGNAHTVALLDRADKGVYRLYKTNMPDGRYTVELEIFDGSGNVSKHTFYQNLDGSVPQLSFLTPEEYPGATVYSKWTNKSGVIAIDAEDSLSGIYKAEFSMVGGDTHTDIFSPVNHTQRITRPVSNEKTGRIRYTIRVYNNARNIDMDKNTYKEGTSGTSVALTKTIWLDKTPPAITLSHEEDVWYPSPYTVTASFSDPVSKAGVSDSSGIKDKLYAITSDSSLPTEWLTYTDGVVLSEGGLWYLHFKLADNAGNETVITKQVLVNMPAEITGAVRPTDDYLHTIYYKKPEFFVVKNTAYNTKYVVELSEQDLNDTVKVNAVLRSRDGLDITASAEGISLPNGGIEREVIFNMPYISAGGEELPDGVYDMYLTITEIKDGVEVVTRSSERVCRVVIKRSAPPEPVISVTGGKVVIEYPDEPLAGSLNTAEIKALSKREYKAVIEGDTTTNVYRPYTEPLDKEDMTVTALYTDIAGNTSTSTLRVYGDEDDGRSGPEVGADGDSAAVEESRAGSTYYIGIRREKTSGVNADIFGFME